MSKADEREMAKCWFEVIAEKTADGLGVTRPSYSRAETRAIDWLQGCARQVLGLFPYFDAAGNMWMQSRESGLKRYYHYVLTGSHVDSVAQGGNYDGLAGVVAGMLAVARINSPFARAIALRGEESAWFGIPYKGSKAIFGKLPPSEALDAALLAEQIPLREVVRTYDSPLLIDPPDIHAFIELHIEQGPVLLSNEIQVAAVTGIAGNVRYKITVHGEAAHSGATPMNLRKDAVLGAIEFLHEAYCLPHSQHHVWVHPFHGRPVDGVATCGSIHTDVKVNAGTRVAERCEFLFEYRSVDAGALDRNHERLERIKKVVEECCNVLIAIEQTSRSEPTMLDKDVRSTICSHLPNPGYAIASGAGHDAAVFQENGVRSGMIFVRNANGSHNPRELMDMDDFMLGVDALEATIRELIRGLE